ncbi:uncharacterized protein LOC121594793 [Anopheles merus]|uniref:uncharacterized protein LOC121594793 n=1 Tax=Anopheles merus TaxID=30066 RepID=UPI001BE3FF88|nr:uncharacterized protein LOC121594793 [Anopheles merus]
MYGPQRPYQQSGSMQKGRGMHRDNADKNSGTRRPQCWRCTSFFHTPGNCHAIDKRCRRCQSMGHIERACNNYAGTKRRPAEEEGPHHPKIRKIAAITNGEDNVSVIADEDKETAEVMAIDSQQFYASLCYENSNKAIIRGYVAGIPVGFLIDSGADVNTVDENTFTQLKSSGVTEGIIFNLKGGSDRPPKAYGMTGEIPVVASFAAQLRITEERPCYMEQFYVIQQARPLLSRSTSLRYSVLQLGINVPINSPPGRFTPKISPGEIFVLSTTNEFPKFNVAPVMIFYDKTAAPSRNIFTNIPPAFRKETERRLEELLSSGIVEKVTNTMEKSFCSSLLVVPKGKNDIRLVVDLGRWQR